MGWRVEKSGVTYDIWSTVVDDYIYENLTAHDLIELYRKKAVQDADELALVVMTTARDRER